MLKTFSPTRSLIVKLICSFSLIVIATSAISGLIIYRSNQTLFQEEIKNQFFKTNEQSLQRINQSVHEVERITQSIVFQPTVVEILMGTTGPMDKVQGLQSLYEVVSQAKLDAPDIRAMFIYNLQGDSYYNANYGAVSMLDTEARSYIDQELEGTRGALTWFRMKLASSADPDGYRTMIIAARLMKSTWQETYGTLVLVLDEGFFSEVTAELEGESGKVYLLDKKDRVLFTGQQRLDPVLDEIPLQYADEESESVVRATEEGNYLFVKKESSSGNFKLVSGLSLREMDKRNSDIFKTIALSGLISILLTSLLLAMASSRLLRPLRELVVSMRRIRYGQMNARVEVRTKDELAFLGETFNDMIDHIHTLINEVLLKQLREKEAELRTLQAQLNPHFLYNIFNEIYWKLYLQNVKDTANIIKSLSNILQYSLKPIELPSTLHEEMEQIKSYIAIQMELFHPELELTIQVEEAAAECPIQRLILQPTIENIFVHAFERKMNAGNKKLSIHAYLERNILRIDIADNGKGIEPELLQRLQDPSHDILNEHLGVQNVKRRIHLVHGGSYGLEFASRIDGGTLISYILPMGKEEQA